MRSAFLVFIFLNIFSYVFWLCLKSEYPRIPQVPIHPFDVRQQDNKPCDSWGTRFSDKTWQDYYPMTRTGMNNPLRMVYDMAVAQDYSPKWIALYSAYPKLCSTYGFCGSLRFQYRFSFAIETICPSPLWEDSIYCSLSDEPMEVVKSEKSLGIQYLNILKLPGFVRNTLARVWYKAG